MVTRDSMRAVTVREPGGVDTLELSERPWPTLQPGCVELEVTATALNRADLLQRRGHHPPPRGVTDILGLECSGIVRQVAPEVVGFSPGDRVMALLPGGGYAERVVAPAERVMRVPDTLDLVHAAGLPEAFLTASEVLFEVGRAKAGEFALVHAAASGVGSAAVQLGRHAGLRIIATAGSADKVALASRLGAEHSLDRTQVDFADRCLEITGESGVNLVVDFVGRSSAAGHLRCLAEAGRWVIVGLLSGGRAEIDLSQVLRRRLTLSGFSLRSRSESDKADIVRRFETRFRAPLDQGQLAPVIDSVYPLHEVRAAHQRMEDNLNIGKILLRVSDDASPTT